MHQDPQALADRKFFHWHKRVPQMETEYTFEHLTLHGIDGSSLWSHPSEGFQLEASARVDYHLLNGTLETNCRSWHAFLSRLVGLCVAMLANWVPSLYRMQTGATALQPTILLVRCSSCQNLCFFCWYGACIVSEQTKLRHTWTGHGMAGSCPNPQVCT